MNNKEGGFFVKRKRVVIVLLKCWGFFSKFKYLWVYVMKKAAFF